MKKKAKYGLLFLAACLLMLFGTSTYAQQLEPTDLGTLGGTFSFAHATDGEWIVGESSPAGDQSRRAFAWNAEDGMFDLGTFGGDNSIAKAVHNGMVVGNAERANDLGEHAFAWTKAGGRKNIGTLGGCCSDAVAVHNGMAVGYSQVAGDTTVRAFAWTSQGGIIDLGTLGGSYSTATSVHNGVVVGISATAGDASEHAFLWTETSGMVNLGTLGGTVSRAYAINNDVVVGGATNGAESGRAFRVVWNGDPDQIVMDDLGTLGGNYSIAEAVDENGRIAGSSTRDDETTGSFTWTEAGGMEDLNLVGDSSVAAVSDDEVVGSADEAGAGAGFLASVARSMSGFNQYAFRWTEQEGAINLGTFGGTFSGASDVKKGKIVGSATTTGDAEEHGILWAKPVPCSAIPQVSCRVSVSSRLLIKDASNDRRDKLAWHWVDGQATSQAEFSNPLGTTSYLACVYAGAGDQLLMGVEMAAHSKKWRAIKTTGYRYRAGRARGLSKRLVLRGSASDEAKIFFVARGENLPDPELNDLESPVRIQLVSSEGLCWESVFGPGDILATSASLFSAKQ